jgi:NAD(P)H-flavin reductase
VVADCWRIIMFKVVEREEKSDGNVILNEIEAPRIARKAKPGQFVILKVGEESRRSNLIAHCVHYQ